MPQKEQDSTKFFSIFRRINDIIKRISFSSKSSLVNCCGRWSCCCIETLTFFQRCCTCRRRMDVSNLARKSSRKFKSIICPNIYLRIFQSGSLLHTAPLKEKITDAEWSPTRPGVFFISKQNGSIDIWDIVDRTHAPSLSQSISSSAVTYLNIKNISCKQFSRIFLFSSQFYF